MPHTVKKRKNGSGKAASRHTVALTPSVVRQVQRYADQAEIGMSKALATLVRIGLESQQARKQEFFRRLKENLANDDPLQEDRLVDEFRSLILGH